MDPLTSLRQRSGEPWLIGCDSQNFFVGVERVLAALRSRPHPEVPLTILLAERDPLTFLAQFIAACAANCHLVLANPDWAEAEWQQVFKCVQPDLIWGQEAEGRRQEAEGRRQKVKGQAHSFPLTPHSSLLTPSPSPLTPLILIPTGGTSGKLRFAIHTWKTLTASVDGFCAYFEVKQVNSFCVLPLYHVSGLMQFLRSFTTGGQLVVLPFRAVEAGDYSSINPEDFFLSLVPTQLQRLLDKADKAETEGQTAETQRRGETFCHQAFNDRVQKHATSPTDSTLFKTSSTSLAPPAPSAPSASLSWLSRFHTVLLGGAPAWSGLLDRARHQRIRLAPTYGMTETASQIATLKPDDFLNGHTNAGQVLPHAQITIRCPSGKVLKAHQIGNITIQATSLAIGYHPPIPPSSHSPTPYPILPAFQPDDLGFFDTDGYLHIIGRQSDKIITGGENVFPAEVEAAIRSTGLVQDVCVLGVSDRHWGQAIAAVYVPINPNTPSAAIQSALADKLCKFKRPKHWLAVDQLPCNAQGKVNRSHVDAIATHRLSSVPAID